MIALEGVSKSYGERVVFDDLWMTFPQSGIVGIAGPSGCGKTTLLRLIAGLEQPDSGRVVNPYHRCSMVFEDDVLLPWLDVRGNVALAVKNGNGQVDEALRVVELAGEAHSRISELSGGMRRRCAIARALAADAELLLLDEPTLRLNDELSHSILTEIRERYRGRLVIMVTHDTDVARMFCDVIHWL